MGLWNSQKAISMSIVSNLPSCSEIALAHSQKLQAIIREEIKSAGGWIPFARYMELALYQPGLGYYNGGAVKLGGEGDFITAPEISPLFGCTLARQIIQILEQVKAQCDQADILEFGAGSGKLANDLLQELERNDCLPQQYYILEVSAELRERQQRFLTENAPHLMSRIVWLEQLPDKFFGAIVANEVIDAMPVHLVEWQGNTRFERGVIWREQKNSHGGSFDWENRPIDDASLKAVADNLIQWFNPQFDPGFSYVSEINLAAGYFMHSLAKMLQLGAAIIIDYGFGRSEYYHSQRSQGTLMCHYRHHAHGDPFYLPGLQDITSHVDFSTLFEAADEAGLVLTGYTTQAHFLMNCGITEILSRIPTEDMQQYLPLANQLQKLVSPAEMGELFKVIAFAKAIDQPFNGFSGGDKSRLL